MKQDQSSLNGFLEKATVKEQPKPTPKLQLPKPKFCSECRYLVQNSIHKSSTLVSHFCKLTGSFTVTPETKACEQALFRQGGKMR